MLRTLCAPLVVGLCLAAAAASAQTPRPVVSKDPAALPAGTYPADVAHTSLLARVHHQGGLSWTILRFGDVSGNLVWDPANLERSKVDITVKAKSISTPVKFVEDLTDTRFLSVEAHPNITFVSTGITRTGPTTGKVAGNFTFRGVTKPIVIDAELVGAGRKADGTPAIGFHGEFAFKRADYGLTFGQGSIGDDIQIVIDMEFIGPKPPAAPAAPPPPAR